MGSFLLSLCCQTRWQRLFIEHTKPQAAVKRRIPGDIAEGGEGHRRIRRTAGMVNDLRHHRPADALALPRLVNGNLDDKQRVIQRFGQQEAGELSVGDGDQTVAILNREAMLPEVDRRTFCQLGEVRNEAKRLGRRAFDCGQTGDIALRGQAKSRCGGYSVIFHRFSIAIFGRNAWH